MQFIIILRKRYKSLRYNEFNKIAIFLKFYLLLYTFMKKNKAHRIIFFQLIQKKVRLPLGHINLTGKHAYIYVNKPI
jgi:hypothetical protein